MELISLDLATNFTFYLVLKAELTMWFQGHAVTVRNSGLTSSIHWKKPWAIVITVMNFGVPRKTGTIFWPAGRLSSFHGQSVRQLRGCIQKLPDWVD